MKFRFFSLFSIIGILLAPLMLGADTLNLSPEARAENFRTKKNVALSGYDPVAYFNTGPEKGSKQFSHTYKGVTYRFASAENVEIFKADPAKYEPVYGGWCAWAMYDGGGRVKINPKSYKIVEGKLYLFYDGLFGDTLKMWNERVQDAGEGSLISAADEHWREQLQE